MTTKAISYRRMWRLDQILLSRFGWDIVHLLGCGARDKEHHTRAGVKLAQYIPEDQVDSVFDCLFDSEVEIDAVTMWSLLGLPGEMPAVAPQSRRRGRRGMSVADMLAARKAPAPAPVAVAPPVQAPVAVVAPAPVAVAPAPDPMMAQMLALLQTMQATNAALASRLTALENELGVDADLPPVASPVQEEPVVEDAQEEPAEELAEDTQEEPEAIEAF